METSGFWGSSSHRCLLVFTSALLLCEIVVGRLCTSLINTVDSFHTLYVLIHLTLHPLEMFTGASVTSIANPYTSPEPDAPAARHPNTISTVDGPSLAPDPNPLPCPSALQPEHAGVGHEDQYSTSRIQPFGAVVSALLLGSLCVSITLEIITHTLQPHVIKRPLLATLVGAASLLFNLLILVWRRSRERDLGAEGLSKDLTETPNEAFADSYDKAKVDSRLGGSITPEVEETGHRNHCGSLHGGVLMFCNPGAPSVLDPEHCTSTLSNSEPLQSNHAEISSEATDRLPPSPSESGNYVTCVRCTGSRNPGSSRCAGQKRRCIRGIKAATRCLLGSVLVLAHGLAHLLGAQCLQPRWDCRLLPYLDPAFSMVTVLVLIATALPELRHHALVLLQAAPAHLRMDELISSIGCVPGVVAIHELHVWQLSEARLVASVHVHCPSGLGAMRCSELLVTVTEVLKRFGVNHCTVQPEFITNTPQPSGERVEPAVPATAGAEVHPYCSLRCGKECANKMCCSTPEEPPCSTSPSTVDLELRPQDVVIENTYL